MISWIPFIGPWLAAQGQKLIIGGLTLALVGALGYLALTYAENRHLAKVNSSLDQRINSPVNGYVKQLAQADTNVEQLKRAQADTVKRLTEKAVADAATLAETQRKLTELQAKSAVAKRQSAVILTGPSDLASVDARIMETLK